MMKPPLFDPAAMKSLLASHLPDVSRLVKPSVMSDVAALLERVLPGSDMRSPHGFGGGHVSPGKAKQSPAYGPGQFLAGSFTNEAGTRPYKLYIPTRYHGEPTGLIVMLHGCTQSADDFAAGTQMNEAAEAAGWLVLYPEQVSAANMNRCWNWFNANDQVRGRGEPALLAGMTREIMANYAVDPASVFVAGLSAGGAAAVVLGSAYPELFAAVGVHSGLALGAAQDMGSAFMAMQQGRPGAPGRASVATIVFHGDRDTTVNVANADAVVAQVALGPLRRSAQDGQAPGGRSYTRTCFIDLTGYTAVEQWSIHGAGHAWSGGSTAGSFTDPKGPDATGEMLRFFRDHPVKRPREI